MVNTIVNIALECGAKNAQYLPGSAVVTDPVFRKICEGNACGKFNRCYMCPPDIGPVEQLMAEIKKYPHAVLYQTIGTLEDSFDFEGMMEAGKNHKRIAQSLRAVVAEVGISDPLHLGAGGCRVCPVCAKRTGEACRHPKLAMSSLEAYGIHVSRLAVKADMKYINGRDTVTYFGAIFFKL